MAKEHDINVHLRAQGTQQVQEDLGAIADSAERMGQQAASAGKEGAAGTEQLGQAAQKSASLFESLSGKVAAYAAGLFGVHRIIGMVTDAIRQQSQALQENAEIARRQQESFLRLQFLGDYFKEHPEGRKEVAALAEFGRRPFEEVAGAWYNLRSKSAALPKTMQDQILKEALETGRTDPSMPLDTLVDMFTLYAKKTGVADANRIQNVLAQTIVEAGGTGADVAAQMPQFLPIGMAGGLSGAQAAGLWAWATTQTADAASATTGLRSVFMGLMGKETPQSAEMLQSLGIDPKMSFEEKIKHLAAARAAGKLDLGAAEQLAGMRGAALLLDMAAQPEAMSRTMRSVVGADRGDIDLTGDKIREIFGADAVAKLEEDQRLMEIAIQGQRVSERAMRAELLLRQKELLLREHMPEYFVKYGLRVAGGLLSMGVPEEYIFGQREQEMLAQRGYGNTVIHYNQNTIIQEREPAAEPRTEAR